MHRFTSLNAPRCRPLAGALALASALLITACGGGSNGDGGSGSARIYLTDAPACGYDEVNVTVERIRVHQSSGALETDSGWSDLVLAPARRIDLLDLTNGVLEELGSVALPVGTYTQVRLVLASNTGSDPLANSVRLTGGGETDLKTPSGQQSGVKINTRFDVAANQVADLVLDFDACKSIVKAGNSGQYLLKPVITAIPVFARAGNAIEGYVNPALGATVSAQQGGVAIKATIADAASGKFILSPVMAGSYDLVLSAGNSATAVITAVPVTDTARTVIASAASPLGLAQSTSRNAAGNVITTGSTIIPDATVRVLQKLTGGPNIELIGRPVDSTTGAYAFSLPIAAPGKAPYAAGATYTFTADAPVAAKYTLEAAVPTKPTQAADIDLTTADAVTNFAFAL